MPNKLVACRRNDQLYLVEAGLARRRRLPKLLVTLLLGPILTLVLNSSWALSFGSVTPSSVQAWKNFRAAQPFQTQVIGITGKPADAERTLVISEPPPSLDWLKIQQLVGTDAAGCQTHAWSVMSGGRVTDVVCTLRTSSASRTAELLARLQSEVFGSAEGASVVSLPAPQRTMTAHSLDLRYSATDLHSWLLKANPLVLASPLAPGMPVRELMAKSLRGVFTTTDRSLVLWSVDRGRSLQSSRADIRRFVLAGDLVLGAIADQRSVLIVARGRIEPIAHLPPLRSETILLLAGSGERELAQSYERNDWLSGKGSDGVDRAPILLSPQLVDTEFGTLLNVADQLLKGWSMAGEVRYVDFRYKDPPRYPFGYIPAANVEPGRDEFLFNWNTDGAAYVQTLDGVDAMVPQRTGSLSVIYGDMKNRPHGMETTAYDYFATSGDSSLSRVQQYTLLYQIFRQFGISSQRPTVSPRYQSFSAQIDAVTRRQFRWLMQEADEDVLLSTVTAVWKRKFDAQPDSSFANEPGGREGALRMTVLGLWAMLAELRDAQRASNGAVSEAFADIVAAERREAGRREGSKRKEAIDTLIKYVPESVLVVLLKNNAEGLRQSGLMQVGMEGIKGWQTLASVDSGAGGWNRTAYVVQSKGKPTAVGGHNLSAPIVRFADDANIARGAVSVTPSSNGGWTVHHNPSDADRLRALAREVGTRKDLSKAEIESQVAAAIKSARAEPPVTLAQVRKATGNAAEFKPVAPQDAVWRVRAPGAEEQRLLASLSDARHDAIVMELAPDGSFVLSRTGVNEVMQLSTVTAATDALSNALLASAAAGRGNIPVLMKGMPSDKAEAWLGTIQTSLRRYSKDNVDAVLASAPDRISIVERAALVNSRIAHNGLQVDKAGIVVTRVNDGPWSGFTRVEVPVKVMTAQPWYMRFVLYIKDIGQASMDVLVARIGQVLLSIRGPVSPREVQALVRRELDKDLRELQVDGLILQFPSDTSHKVHDIYIAHDNACPSTRAA